MKTKPYDRFLAFWGDRNTQANPHWLHRSCGRKLGIESLETRDLLSISPLSVEPLSRLARAVEPVGWELSTAVANVDTATGYQAAGLPVDSKQGPLAKGTGLLTELYADFVTNQSVTAGSRSQALGLGDGLLQMINDRVLTSIRYSGSSSALEQSLVATGATIESRLDFAPVIEVWLPISQLMSIAERDEVESITPVYAGTTSKQGIADNQADRVSRTDVLRTQSGLTGQGVTVGVISDSANRFGSGLAGSVASGDLPPDVTLLRDRFSKSDEGRAMMEEVYDIAPAASLKFADWGSSMSDFATSVDQLRLNGADVIVDDIRYWAEPMFQPGVIDRAITRAVNAGISYFSSAGNSGPGGYEDYFYLVDSNGTKRQDFLRGSGVDTFLRVYIPNNAKPLILQWSEPYDGVTGSANSDVDIYIYDTAGSLRAKGVDNNLQNHIPMELVPLSGLPTGYYDIRIVLYATQSGESAPAEFKFVKEDLQVLEHTGGTVIVSSAYGHSVGPNTIGVGAVPFFNAAPYSTTTPVQNDWFSAYGKPVYYFDENFGELASPKVYQSPQVSGVDGVNTSFFGSDTTRDSDTLPNFFGTSAAAPNAAAVAALLLESVPTASPAIILQSLISSTTPLNGAAAGSWDIQGGFGLIDGPRALAKLRQLLQPEIRIRGGGVEIVSGDAVPSLSDGTDFGTATLATGQVTHTFTIANLGTRVLQLNGSTRVQVTGVNPADFVVTTLPSASVPIGGTTTFSIRFDPSGIGLRRARVAIANDDANENPYVFDIQGTGTNAAPVLNNSGTPYLNEVSEDDLANMGTTVPELLGRGAGGDPISDADNDPEGIAVTGVNASLGTWQYSLNGGATWTNIGAPTTAASTLLPSTTATRVRLLPLADLNGSFANAISFRAWDQSTGTSGGSAATTVNGGNTAFSIAIESANITIGAVNDAPFNSLPAPQATRVDTAILFSMANGNRLAIGDKEATIFTVRLNAVGGRLHVTNLPAGLTVSGNDTTAVILTGSLASINAALDGLSFVPNTGFQGSGSLTVITNDLGVAGAGGALTDTDTLQISVRNPQQVEGRTLILTGTVASDSIAVVFDTTSDYRASVNGVTQSYSTTSVDQILILSGAGADTIDVTDAPGSDIATFAAGYATIAHANYRFDIYSPRIYVRGDVLDSSTFNNSGPVNAYLLREYAIMQATDNSFFNEAINFGSHTANASGDDDTLFLYGDAGNQTYVGTFNQALLVSTDRRLTGNNFKSVYVYGISGTDNATVIGTSGDERVDAYPTYVRVTSGAKLQYLSQFDVVSVRSGGGAKDVANFYDSAGNDTFVSRPDYSTFTGTGFRIVVQDFDIVHAIHSAGGTDVATLTGSTGNDTFTGTATTSILIAASGMRQQVSGYSRVTVMASSGNDVATLVDSSGNDTLTAKSDYAELLYSAGNRITVKAFDAVYARGLNGGTNRKLVTDPLAFQLRFSGTWV